MRMMIKVLRCMTAMATTICNDDDGPPQALATTIMTPMATTIMMPKRERGTDDPFRSHLSPTDARPLSRWVNQMCTESCTPGGSGLNGFGTRE